MLLAHKSPPTCIDLTLAGTVTSVISGHPVIDNVFSLLNLGIFNTDILGQFLSWMTLKFVVGT